MIQFSSTGLYFRLIEGMRHETLNMFLFTNKWNPKHILEIRKPLNYRL